MQINTETMKPSFGWNKTTHLDMTMLAIKDFNIDEITKRQIARYSQMPDFDKLELGFHNNTHFFFPNSSQKSFGPKANLFNAFNQFQKYMVSAAVEKDNNKFLRYLGYATHYLQDITVPLHTEPGGFLQKIFKCYLHKEFETNSKFGAIGNSKKLIDNYKFEKIESNSLLDLFTTTAEFSQKPELKVKFFNKKEWFNIQQICFNKGVNVSREFIKKILNTNNIIY